MKKEIYHGYDLSADINLTLLKTASQPERPLRISSGGFATTEEY